MMSVLSKSRSGAISLAAERRTDLAVRGFVLLGGVIPLDQADFVAAALVRDLRHQASDSQVGGAPAIYRHPVNEELLQALLPLAEAVAGEPLYTTYSYVRLYQTGATLAPHTDREACELSISINLGGDLPAWPLWIRGGLGAAPIRLAKGEAVLFDGRNCEHWRKPLRSSWCLQSFLHYVRKSGPFADWQNDSPPTKNSRTNHMHRKP